MTPLQAIKNRDPEALMAAFLSVEEAAEFRRLVLPEQSSDDCRWFWQQIMTPIQLETTMSFVRDACLRIAKELDLVNGVHFSQGFVDDMPTMICSEQVAAVFYAWLPRDRHSVLRFYLQIASL